MTPPRDAKPTTEEAVVIVGETPATKTLRLYADRFPMFPGEATPAIVAGVSAFLREMAEQVGRELAAARAEGRREENEACALVVERFEKPDHYSAADWIAQEIRVRMEGEK